MEDDMIVSFDRYEDSSNDGDYLTSNNEMEDISGKVRRKNSGLDSSGKTKNAFARLFQKENSSNTTSNKITKKKPVLKDDEILHLGVGLQNIQMELIQMITDLHGGLQVLKDYNPKFDRIEKMLSSNSLQVINNTETEEENKDFSATENTSIKSINHRLEKLEKLMTYENQGKFEEEKGDDSIYEYVSTRFDTLEKIILANSSKENIIYNRSVISRLEDLENLIKLRSSTRDEYITQDVFFSQMKKFEVLVNSIAERMSYQAKENDYHKDALSARLDHFEQILLEKADGAAELQPNSQSFVKEEFINSKFDLLEKRLEKIQTSAKEDTRSSFLYMKFLDSQINQRSFAQYDGKAKSKKRKTIAEPKEEYCYHDKVTISKVDEIKRIIHNVVTANPFFPNLTNNEVSDVVGSFSSIYFNAGSIILSQGDYFEYYFIIESGEIDLFRDGEYQKTLSATIVNTPSFGEASFLLFECQSPYTYRARVDCKLWQIQRKDLRNLICYHKQQKIEENGELLKNVKIGSKRLGDILDSKEIVDLALVMKNHLFGDDTKIIREGELEDTLYIIEHGEVNVYNRDSGNEALVSFTNGNFFGENCLFSDDTKSSVTCIAKSDLYCLSLKRQDFIDRVGNLDDIINNFKLSMKEDEEKVKEDHKPKSLDTEEMSTLRRLENVRLKDLEPIKQLGRGRFSTTNLVKCVKDSPVKSLFALKVISKQRLFDNRILEYVQVEKEILKHVFHHPFIIKLYSEFQDDDNLYFLQELLSTEDLWNIIAYKAPISENWCQFYTASILLALDHIHKRKIVHRDIKPENIKLDANGFLKITGFLVSTELCDRGKTWTLCGTLDYLSPEMMLNQGYAFAVDYWALGVMVFEMSTGSKPFIANEDSDVCRKIISGSIDYPSHLSSNLIEFIGSLCCVNQWDRVGGKRNGLEKAKYCAWFTGFSWDNLEKQNMLAPYVPESGLKVEKLKMTRSISFEKKKNRLTFTSTSTNNDNNDVISVGTSVKEAEITKSSTNPEHITISDEQKTQDDQIQDEFDRSSLAPRLSEISVAKDITKEKGYKFGKNRYEEKLKEFLLNQRKSNSVRSLGSAKDVNEQNDEPDKNDAEEALQKMKLTAQHAWKFAATNISSDPFQNEEADEDQNSSALEKSVSILGSFLSRMRVNFDSSVVSKSFERFFLLSLSHENVRNDTSYLNKKCRYLDPFICRSTSLVDSFPAQSPKAKDSLTSEEISVFCFPSGLKIRLIPRCTLKGAQRAGWIGSNADVYKVHNFTSAKGDSCYGVSITVRAECHYPIHGILSKLREKRKAAYTICRCLTRYYEMKNQSKSFRRMFKKKDGKNRVSSKMFGREKSIDSSKGLFRQQSRRNSMPGRPSWVTKNQEKPGYYDNDPLQGFTEDVRIKAIEAYYKMIENEREDDICIVEKCYIMIGTRVEELSLILNGLQNLVDIERKNLASGLYQNLEEKRSTLLKKHAQRIGSCAVNEQRLAIDRHFILKAIQNQLCLTPHQNRVKYPNNQLEHLQNERPRLELNLTIRDFPQISLPLPLPNVTNEYGVALLLLRVKSANLLHLLSLMLLERSVLIIGTRHEEVTTATVALLSLLKPFKWASAFMPLIPIDMLDFVGSPVPFLGGVIVDKEAELISIENDERVRNAINEGLTVVNLNSGKVMVTMETGLFDIVNQYQCVIRNQISCLQERLESSSQKDYSSLNSFKSFFQKGLSATESVTISSVQRALYLHFKSLFRFVLENPEEWQKYGEYDEINKVFEFFPSRLLQPLQMQLKFQEIIVHTQLFQTFVEERKNSYLNLNVNRKAAQIIATWCQSKWREICLKKSNSLLEVFAKRTFNSSLGQSRRALIMENVM